MIAHVDADAFFASALQRKRPELRGKELLTLGMGGGCVIAASYEAKAKGVKTGMRLGEARVLCPKAIAIPSDFDEALLASRQIEHILQNRCPIIQRYSVDEWYLDVKSITGGLPDNLKQWALALQEDIHTSVGLTVSIGVSTSKLLAKMASEYVKPEGATIVLPQTRQMFLEDRLTAAIPGIGKRRELHTASLGFKTAWDFANADSAVIQKLFGKTGLILQRELCGECTDAVSNTREPPKSISRTRSFRLTSSRDMVYAHLLHHLTYTILKMRREGLACKAVSVWLRSGTYTVDQKESKLPQPADTEERILPYIHRCFDELYEYGRDYTQIGLGLYGLNPKGGTQYNLFENPKHTKEAENIQKAMDELHARYGREALKRGAAMPVVGSKPKRLNVI